MGKLFSLKEWLTVADAARHLTIAFGEEVTEADVLRLALDRRLRLSLYFPNTFYAKPVSEPLLAEVSKETDKMLLDDNPSLDGRVWSKRDDFEMLLSGGLASPDFSDAYKYESEIRLAGGAWWFVYNPCAEQSLESRFHVLMGLDQSPPSPNSGSSLIIKGNHDYYYEVLESDGDSGMRPAQVFPKGTTVVVRTEALREFEAAINGTPAAADKPLATTERNTLLTIIAALCDYSGIDPKARGAVAQIAKLTDELGATVSPDTVGRALAKIPDALEARMK